MSGATSSATNQTRSTRFLIAQRGTATKSPPSCTYRINSWPNIIKLAEIASLFGLDKQFLCTPAKINSAKAVDELIRTFFLEVNDHHFPVKTNYWSDDETLQHPALQGWIPVKPKGFDCWHYDDPITLFMALAGLEDDPDPALDMLATDYPQFDIPGGFKLSDTLPILARMDLGEHLTALPDLIRMVTRRTGTFFLDHSPAEFDFYQDQGASINWSAENVAWLREDWQRAKPIHKRAWQLIDWTMAAKCERTALLIEVVLSAYEVIS